MKYMILSFALIAGLIVAAAHASQTSPPPRPPVIRALIVGAATFDDAAVLGKLDGARHDAILMAATLRRLGTDAQNIRLLISHAERAAPYYQQMLRDSGVSVAGLPREQDIEQGLAALAADAKPGDQIVVLFSGHGDQQDAQVKGPDQEDLDQVFLPEDAVRGQRTDINPYPRYQHAVIDDDIGRRFDAIRARGADIFFIADFCHSTGSTRAGDQISRPSMDLRDHVAATAAQPGSLVAFFAAPTDAKAKQALVPYWDIEQQHNNSVLTYFVASGLAQQRFESYDELFGWVNSQTLFQRQTSNDAQVPLPTPQGPIGQRVLGRPSASHIGSSWSFNSPIGDGITPVTLDGLTLNAGSLAGIAHGTIFSIAPSIGPGAHEPLFYGRAEKVDPFVTRIVPISYGGIGLAQWRDVRWRDPRNDTGSTPIAKNTPLVATIVDGTADPDFIFRLPEPGAAPRASERAVLASLARGGALADHSRLAKPGEQADLIFKYAAGKLQVLSSDNANGVLYGAISIAGPDATRAAVSRAIQTARQYKRVRAALGQIASDTGTEDAISELAPSNVKTEFYLYRTNLARPACDDPAAQQRLYSSRQSVPVGSVLVADISNRTLRACDEVYVRVKNTSRVARFNVEVLLVSQNGQIDYLATADGRDGGTLLPAGLAGSNGFSLGPAFNGKLDKTDIFVIVRPYDDGEEHRPPISNRVSQGPIVCPEGQHCDQQRGEKSIDGYSPNDRRLLKILEERGGRGSTVGVAAVQHYTAFTVP